MAVVFNAVMCLLVYLLIAAYAWWFWCIAKASAIQAWEHFSLAWWCKWRIRSLWHIICGLWWTFIASLGLLYLGLVLHSQM